MYMLAILFLFRIIGLCFHGLSLHTFCAYTRPISQLEKERISKCEHRKYY